MKHTPNITIELDTDTEEEQRKRRLTERNVLNLLKN